MRLACQQRGRPKEIALINVVEDFVVDAVWRLRNFDATLTYQIKRIAWFPFAENYLAGVFSENANSRRDLLADLDVTASCMTFYVYCLYAAAPGLLCTAIIIA